MSTDTAMDNLWVVDAGVLAAIVRAIEIEGEQNPEMSEIYSSLGLSEQAGARSVRRLVEAGMVSGRSSLGGTWTISGVSERGLRHAGAWPDDASRLAEQIIAALAEAAENESEPERRSRLQRAAGGVAAVGRDLFAEVLAAVIARSAGL